MQRLLSRKDKKSVRETFKNNAVFKSIKKAYKDFEVNMDYFQFSTEEIFINCFIELDRILKNRDDMTDIADTLWVDVFTELRDEAEDEERNYNREELETATSIIVHAVAACLMASNNDELDQFSKRMFEDIASHSNLEAINDARLQIIENDFPLYIEEYIKEGKYLSEQFDNMGTMVDPINPVLTQRDRLMAKNGVKKRLEFMSGVLPDGEIKIMTKDDYHKMIEAVEYLIENNVVKKQDKKLKTSMNVAALRYTFYLVYKNEGKCIQRNLWIDFLHETFFQMKDNADSLSKHFADKPQKYDKKFGIKKKN